MQFDGFTVEKWRAQMMGAIDISEAEGLEMRSDALVVMVVATRVRKSIPEPLDEDGTMRVTRQNRIEHLAVLTGPLREQALSMLASGSDRGFQQALDVGNARQADPLTGEIPAPAPRYASYAEPPAPEPAPEPDPVRADLENLRDELAGGSTIVDDVDEFHVPVAKDEGTFSETVVVGSVRDYATNAAAQAAGGDGPQVGRVNYDELVEMAPGAAANGGPGTPVGERVGSVYPGGTRKDKDLAAFFEEDIPHE